MRKRILIGLGAAGTALALLPLFAAFEAHVINVTAKIENALDVPVKFLDYGTVFPQEYLVKDVAVSLSRSFIDEDRVDDIEYIIRQKPKCAITWNNGTEFDDTIGPDGTHLYTRTGHLMFDAVDRLVIDCGESPRALAADNPNTAPDETETWGVLPSLCEYLSKHKEDDGQFTGNPPREVQLNAFHTPYTISGHLITWNEAKGYLTKLGNDITDTWKIDLAVPCFGGFCAQDWATFVDGKNPGEGVNAEQWTQPIANQHKIFGCDLWFEVRGVSCTETEETAQSVVSDTTNTVPENGGAPAEALTLIHASWTASIPGATWIWENDPVDNPGIDETFTFEKQFTVSGAVSNATLDIAADNFYRARVNGVLVGEEQVVANNFQIATQDSYPVTNLVSGTNTIKIEVTNEGDLGSTAASNPAGLLYKLAYTASVCVAE